MRGPSCLGQNQPRGPRQRGRAAETGCRPGGHRHTEDCTDAPTAPSVAQDWRPEGRSAVLSGPRPKIPCAAGEGHSPAARQSPCKQVLPSSEKGEQTLAGEPDLPLARKQSSRRATLAQCWCRSCGGPTRLSASASLMTVLSGESERSSRALFTDRPRLYRGAAGLPAVREDAV